MPPRKAPERKRQAKLNFSPAPKTSPTAHPTSSTDMGKSTPNKTTTPTRTRSRKHGKTSRRIQSSSSSEDELQVSTVRSMRMGLPVQSTPYGMFEGSNSDLTSSESEGGEVTEIVAPRKRRQKVNDDNDSDDVVAVRVTPRTRQRAKQITLETSDEDEELRLPNKRRKTRHQRTPNHSPSLPLSDENSIPDEDLEDANDNESDENNATEDEELKEELAFLKSSPLPDRGKLRSTQEKPMNARQKALQALKKRRASANPPSSSATPGRRRMVVLESESDAESEPELEVIPGDSDVESQNTDPDDIEEGDEEYEENQSRPANALDMFQEDQEDVEFIDDDNEALIGEPSATADLDEMRFKNHLKRAKAKELFKHAVEWMVMKRIHPAFDPNAEVYQITFVKLDDEVKGLAGSKFTSSAWTPDFTRSIQSRPNLELSEISNAMKEVLSPHCEACNRSNHVASFELMLTGPPYDADTLEPLQPADTESDSDSNSDSELSADPETHSNGEKVAYNSRGEPLPPESRRFALGSTCKANAQVAHTLQHWKYHLYEWVKDYLDRNGHLTPDLLVKRDKWSNRKRDKAARKIVDGMETNGEVKKLYRLYQDQLNFAQEVKNDYKNGWGKRW